MAETNHGTAQLAEETGTAPVTHSKRKERKVQEGFTGHRGDVTTRVQQERLTSVTAVRQRASERGPSPSVETRRPPRRPTRPSAGSPAPAASSLGAPVSAPPPVRRSRLGVCVSVCWRAGCLCSEQRPHGAVVTGLVCRRPLLSP